MKLLILRLLLGISLIGAVIVSGRSVHVLYLAASANPHEEFVYFLSPATDPIQPLLESFWPAALYLGVLISNRKVAWSRFGKAVLLVHLGYLGLLIAQWVYLYRALPNAIPTL